MNKHTKVSLVIIQSKGGAVKEGQGKERENKTEVQATNSTEYEEQLTEEEGDQKQACFRADFENLAHPRNKEGSQDHSASQVKPCMGMNAQHMRE